MCLTVSVTSMRRAVDFRRVQQQEDEAKQHSGWTRVDNCTRWSGIGYDTAKVFVCFRKSVECDELCLAVEGLFVGHGMKVMTIISLYTTRCLSKVCIKGSQEAKDSKPVKA